MNMKEKIEQLEEKLRALTAETAEEAEQWRIKLLGKKGEITALFDEFRTILRDVISEIACFGAEPARLAAE